MVVVVGGGGGQGAKQVRDQPNYKNIILGPGRKNINYMELYGTVVLNLCKQKMNQNLKW